jgi:hypothetical protein
LGIAWCKRFAIISKHFLQQSKTTVTKKTKPQKTLNLGANNLGDAARKEQDVPPLPPELPDPRPAFDNPQHCYSHEKRQEPPPARGDYDCASELASPVTLIPPRLYNLNPSQEEAMARTIEENTVLGFIRESRLPYCLPVLFV